MAGEGVKIGTASAGQGYRAGRESVAMSVQGETGRFFASCASVWFKI